MALARCELETARNFAGNDQAAAKQSEPGDLSGFKAGLGFK